jgi:hypothetical protein
VRPGNHDRIPTVSQAVRDATAICDPEGTSAAVRALYEAFEDDDRPTTAVEDLRGELLSTVEGVDPEGDDPVAAAAGAAAFWLATNPGDADNGDHALREGVRLMYADDPPPALGDWLAERDVA